MKLEAINNEKLCQYANGILEDLKGWLVADLGRPESKIRNWISDAAVALGDTMAKNSELSASVNEHLEAGVRHHADNVRSGIAKHISGTMKEWKSEDFINEIELSIGSDLQFIRMNGTLVGGCIGLLLHAVGLLLK